jgi:hypothetical protein
MRIPSATRLPCGSALMPGQNAFSNAIIDPLRALRPEALA